MMHVYGKWVVHSHNYIQVIMRLYCGRNNRITCKILYVSYRNPRFGRRTEEDSHEALRCLLDGLKMEEIDVSAYTYLY